MLGICHKIKKYFPVKSLAKAGDFILSDRMSDRALLNRY
nr:MAG TPA: hypothetical protein [Caudoviricetes sp.]